ncbi:Bidirectional sugar transporter SWEET6a [Capsicum annuum]|nr:Bidirectional sugar transporter SWEET6a [Capsicum annuum]
MKNSKLLWLESKAVTSIEVEKKLKSQLFVEQLVERDLREAVERGMGDRMATEQPKAAAEDVKMDLFEDDDEFEEFEIDQEWEAKEEGTEAAQQWEDDWDDDDVNDDFSLQLKKELESNAEKKPTFVKIVKAKSVMEFKVDPYVATILNCAVWVFYGMPFVHPDSVLIVTINGFGLAIELFYVGIFFIYSDWAKRRKIIIALIIEIIFMVILISITLTCLHGTKDRSMLIGIVAIVFNIIMYTSPLTVMKKVITTKSVKYMPFYLSLANFANGIVWAIYALLKFDIYVLIPNGLGSLSGLVQLLLFAAFYSTTNWNEDEKEVELSESKKADA